VGVGKNINRTHKNRTHHAHRHNRTLFWSLQVYDFVVHRLQNLSHWTFLLIGRSFVDSAFCFLDIDFEKLYLKPDKVLLMLVTVWWQRFSVLLSWISTSRQSKTGEKSHKRNKTYCGYTKDMYTENGSSVWIIKQKQQRIYITRASSIDEKRIDGQKYVEERYLTKQDVIVICSSW